MNSVQRFCVWLALLPCLLFTSATTSLAAVGVATLHWTAPGDDSLTGRATSYDLRWSLSVITTANFATATRVTGMSAPGPAGSAETFTVPNLIAGQSYYFAIKTSDEVMNWSGMSNLDLFTAHTTGTRRTGSYEDRFSAPWPNPAGQAAHWSYALAQEGPLAVEAFDFSGRRVRSISSGVHGAGEGELVWDLRDDGGHMVAPGLYLVRASVGGLTTVRKLTVIH